MDATASGVSIIVPARNEGPRLATFLPDLAELLARPSLASAVRQTVVVLDGCTDDSRQVVERAQVAWPPSAPPLLFLELHSSGGKAAAVHTGLLRASGRYSLLWDADCEYGLAGLAAVVQSVAPRTLVSGVRQSGRGWKSILADLVTRTVLRMMAAGPRTADALTGVHAAETSWMLRVLEHTNGYAVEAALARAAMGEGLWLYDAPVPYRARTEADGRGIRWYHLYGIVKAAGCRPAARTNARRICFDEFWRR